MTRHNIGFIAVDRLAAEAGIDFGRGSSTALTGAGAWLGNKIVLAKPLTFMNLSGLAIKSLADSCRVSGPDIIIVHDDMDFPLGEVRIKTRGGSGGHRGIESILENLATDAFVRLRVGIGQPGQGCSGSTYVLDAFAPHEIERLGTITGLIRDCLHLMLTQGIAAAMNRFHRRTQGAQE